MRLAWLALALAVGGAASLLTHPVTAAVEAQFAGLSCGLETQASEGQDRQTGVVTGGPVEVTLNGEPAGAVLVCRVQRFDPSYGGGEPVAEASASGTGVVFLPPTAVSFYVWPGEPVFVCSELWVNGDRVYRFDDDPDEGEQCADSRPQPGPSGPSYSEPPSIWHSKCFEGDVLDQHLGPYCVPWPTGS